MRSVPFVVLLMALASIAGCGEDQESREHPDLARIRAQGLVCEAPALEPIDNRPGIPGWRLTFAAGQHGRVLESRRAAMDGKESTTTWRPEPGVPGAVQILRSDDSTLDINTRIESTPDGVVWVYSIDGARVMQSCVIPSRCGSWRRLPRARA
jgi:hypothetical protein